MLLSVFVIDGYSPALRLHVSFVSSRRDGSRLIYWRSSSNGYEIMYEIMYYLFSCFLAALVSYESREKLLLSLFFPYAFLRSQIVSTTSICRVDQ
jgi:hypothetical protein